MLSISIAYFLAAATDLPSWNFTDPAQSAAWTPNAQIEILAHDTDGLHLRTTDSDPFLSNRAIEFPATPWQYVLITIKANHFGDGELFWSGNFDGPYGGLNQTNSTRFNIPGDNQWHDLYIFPGWNAEGAIRQLRLDLYNSAEYTLRGVAVHSWADNASPDGSTSWNLKKSDEWFHPDGSGYWWSPPLDLDVDDRPYVSIEAYGSGVTGVLYWSSLDGAMQREEFTLAMEGLRVYDIDVGSYASWKSPIVALGIEFPATSNAHPIRVGIHHTPQAPAYLNIHYFGFDNGVNRAGRVERLRAHITNTGGTTGHVTNPKITVSEGITVVRGPEPAEASVPPGGYTDFFWEVRAEEPGAYSLRLDTDFANYGVSLEWHEPADPAALSGIPTPTPVETAVDVCAYYFPGWGSDASWDPIRAVAPQRKPLLGWYDESKPEVVDWQIKWAVENGITCFLVDWYWNQGGQHLTHWFEAYREARYRDVLDVAIMWANHNPPGSHSIDDWRAVTKEWIDRYFNLPAYYRIDNKPAVFIWDPVLIRGDIGADNVAAMYAESQQMARDAGYEGIAFVAMHNHETAAQAQTLRAEGYAGATNYHEWGRAVEMAPSKTQVEFHDVAATAPDTWARRRETCGDLTYYPVVDTGWDARPWHGAKSLVIRNRFPDDFEALLKQSRTFAEKHDLPFVVLGPLNEWGEGSYIEPNTEYGFDMYEAIRRVFGTGDPASWPQNVGPRDVGLGPYDYPPQPIITEWNFDQDAQGWAPMMSVSKFRVENGAAQFQTDSHDAAIHIATPKLNAEDFSKLAIEMTLSADTSTESTLQLFFASGGQSTSEATSVTTPVHIDGQPHTYTLDLASNTRWRGIISRLRLDPCTQRDVEVRIERIALTH